VRIGIGYDSHRFQAGRRLVLGGVEIPHAQGLAGHSDADVVIHAVIDALLGAAGQGNIGSHFPPDDDRWRNADSAALLKQAVHVLAESNYQVVNVDVTAICEAPRIAPYAAAMSERIAHAIGIGPQHVSVKGKSNEGMGWIGRGEGVAAIAVALIDAMED
jgi:2-C-methyl-D-erythritol 2,4-cyclodiphosphate synthase